MKPRKLLSLLLTLVLCAGLFAGTPLTANAAGEISLYQSNAASVLTNIQSGQTIKLMENVTYNSGVFVGGSVVLDLNGHTLNVVNSNSGSYSIGLQVMGSITLADPANGALNVTGTDAGVWCGAGLAEVTNATATGSSGIGAYYADNGRIHVYGDVTAIGEYGIGASTYDPQPGLIIIEGTITVGIHGTYVFANDPYAQSDGRTMLDQPGYLGYGAYNSVWVKIPPTAQTLTDDNTNVSVSGNIDPGASLSVSEIGSGDASGNAIRAQAASGTLLALYEINITGGSFTGNLTITIPLFPSYNGQTVTIIHDNHGSLETQSAVVTNGKVTFTLTSLSPIGVVNPGDVCEITNTHTGYSTLGGALTAVTNGQTIKLLADIAYNSEIYISGKNVTFDLNGHVLDATAGLTVENGSLLLADPTNGELNVSGQSPHGNYTMYASSYSKAEATSVTASDGTDYATYANGNGEITVYGDVTHNGTSGAPIGACAMANSKITVNGTITVGSSAIYISVGTPLTPSQNDPSSNKPGYLQYSDDGSYVWVWDTGNVAVCSIGGTLYPTLDDALAAVTNGQTIKLLADITHNGGCSINSKNITFDLDNQYNLIFQSAVLSVNALDLDDCDIDYINRGTGSFQAVGLSGGSNGLEISGGSCKLTYAEANRDERAAVYAHDGAEVIVDGDVIVTGDADAGVNSDGIGTSVTVNGDVTATGDGSYGVNAYGGSNVTVTGDISTTNGNGVYADGTGTTVTVNGDIDVADTGSVHYAAIYAKDGAKVFADGGRVTMSDSGTSNEVYGVYVTGDGTEVTVAGDISATGQYSIGVYTDETNGGSQRVTVGGSVAADNTGVYVRDGGTVNVGGGVTCNGGYYGIYAFGSGATHVTGNVTKTADNGAAIRANSNTSGNPTVTVGGSVTVLNQSDGVEAYDGCTVTVGGSITAGDDSYGIYAEGSSSGAPAVTVTGGVTVGDNSTGVYAENHSTVTVGGSITAGTGSFGVNAESGATVNVTGGIIVITGDCIDALDSGTAVTVSGNVVSGDCGVYVYSGAQVTIDATLTAVTAYIMIEGISYDKVTGVHTPTTKTNYFTYTDNTSTVWVFDPAYFVAVTNITGVPTTVAAGTALTLTGTVAPSTASFQNIVWSVKTAGTTGATISGSTLNATAAGTVVVTATIINGTALGTAYAKDFTITVSSGGGAVVTSVSVSPSTVSVQKGTTQQFTASVTGTGSPAQTVTWSVSGSIAGTTISSTGLLTVAAGETATTLTVKATSTVDTTKSGSATVTVTTTPVAPGITGPTSMTLTVGYAATSTGAYTTTGTSPITVTKSSGNTAITWNGATMKLDIAAGLAAGSYPVVLTASNGTLPNATITFTLAVQSGGGYIGGGGGSSTTPSSGESAETATITPEGTPLAGWQDPFTDVKASDWFYNDVAYVNENGLMTGTSATLFSPGVKTTRAMIVTILYREAGSPSVSGLANPFSDVPSGQWYTDAVIWAAANGIVSGIGGGKYDPNAEITRQDLAVILYHYANFAGLKLPMVKEYTGFNDDKDCANYAKDAIESFFKAGIISGKPGNIFDPKGAATRAEMAAMLHRFLEATE